jgi:hypothetical protein
MLVNTVHFIRHCQFVTNDKSFVLGLLCYCWLSFHTHESSKHKVISWYFCWLLTSLFYLGCVYLCFNLPCTFAGWVLILDFIYRPFLLLLHLGSLYFLITYLVPRFKFGNFFLSTGKFNWEFEMIYAPPFSAATKQKLVCDQFLFFKLWGRCIGDTLEED